MAVMKKIAGLVAGASAVAVLGVAVAQGVPPNPFISNPALGAGQQTPQLTPMGETGIPAVIDQVQQTEVRTVPETAQAPAPAPAPAPVAEAPAPAPVEEQQVMGAAPAAPEPQPEVVARVDRN